MVELQSVTHMCGLEHNLCHHVCHRWGVWNGTFSDGFFLDNTRVRIFNFFHRAKRKIFFRNLTLGYMTKTPNQVFFFPPPKSEYFFNNIGNQNIVFVLLTIVGTIYILSSAVICNVWKTSIMKIHKRTIFCHMKGWLTKLSVLTARPLNLISLWTDNGLMEQDQTGCNQIGLHFELHPHQCRSIFYRLQ
jgi:hypothetical protein